MTLLTVVQDVCAVVGVIKPDSVFTNINANRTMFEMVACANEMAQSIGGDERDWTRLIKTQTYTGDGATAAFNLPADYRRMLKNGQVWRSTSTQQPMTFINDADEWMQRRAQGYSNAWGEWMIEGGQMLIYPVMGVGVTAKFKYIDANPITLTSGGFGDRFMADTDTFRLPERVLKLGMIWKWKSQKGGQYAEDMSTYYDALTRVEGSDKPAPILIDRMPISSYARVGASWPPGWGPP